jgi:3-hydroxyacyl-CoA dehydrogenase
LTAVETFKADDILVVSVTNPPVNALSLKVREGLTAAIVAAAADQSVAAIVIRCEGSTFFAGADIAEFGSPPVAPTTPELISLIESSVKPVIAAIHGTALGGGLELALGCHYRIAASTATMGLPEVKLGIIPGAGGTQRLPRLVGIAETLPIIIGGNEINAQKAKGIGLIDRIAQSSDLRSDAIAFARELKGRTDHPTTSARADLIADKTQALELIERYMVAQGRRIKGYEAPLACAEALRASAELPFADGIKLERDLFLKLLQSPQSKALRHLFFATRRAEKINDLPVETPTIPIERVGILGAGTMGGGIAMNFISVGIPVILVEREKAALERGVSTIRKNYINTAARGGITPEEVERAMSLLTPSLSFDEIADCDLVVEAIFEDINVKKDIFRQLDSIVKPGAVLASNTSYLNIDEMAAETKRPEYVVGLHFFSPANVMRLLEVVRGKHTSGSVLKTAMALAKRIRKTAVLAGVCHGFIANRMLAPRQREATKLVLAGATPWDVDRVLRDFGFPMGPFQMTDLAGLDLGWNAATSTSSTLREVLCESDRRGQKNGRGYYDYDENRNATPSPVTEKIIKDFRIAHNYQTRVIDDHEILERLLYPIINEGAQILQEGIAQRPSDIDVVWISGYGWPAFTGGPMFFADAIGLDKIVANLKAHESQLLPEFRMAKLLEEYAASGRKFNG